MQVFSGVNRKQEENRESPITVPSTRHGHVRMSGGACQQCPVLRDIGQGIWSPATAGMGKDDSAHDTRAQEVQGKP